MVGAREFTRRGALGAGLALSLLPVAARGAGRTVSCAAGRFSGTDESGVTAFRGIRYGRAERLRAPEPVAATQETIRATRFGPACPQPGGRYSPQDEDCLFLNIWTNDPHPGAGKPVMVYFHGGAYSSGSVTDPLNDGRRLATDADVVVVTVNHRLNAFGYLYLARLDPRFADSGNAGQLDLLLALNWVRGNIAAFGGDPGRVMVFGQSGGGAKIATLMGMPAAAGLFRSAATMSGQQVTASGPLNAGRRTQAYLSRLGVSPGDLSTLVAMPAQKLVDALEVEDPILGGGIYFGPVLDMKWLTRHPFWPDANPLGLGIPLILGNTRDETRAFIDPHGPKVAGLDWDNLAARMAPELRIDILPEWVVSEYRARFPQMSPADVFYAATTAGRSWRGQVIEAEMRAQAGRPAWVYQLDFASPVEPERGAPHMLDIPLVFGTLDAPGSLTGTGGEARALSARMMSAFAALARTGAPNAPGLPDWPRYELPDRATMIFDKTCRVENDPRRWQRELFARVPYIQPGA